MPTGSGNFSVNDYTPDNPPARSTRSHDRKFAADNTQERQKILETPLKTMKQVNRAPSRKRAPENVTDQGTSKRIKITPKTSAVRQNSKSISLKSGSASKSEASMAKPAAKIPARRTSRTEAKKDASTSSPATLEVGDAVVDAASASVDVADGRTASTTLGVPDDAEDLSEADGEVMKDLKQAHLSFTGQADREDASPKTPASTVAARQASDGLPTPVSAPPIRDTAHSANLRKAFDTATNLGATDIDIRPTDTNVGAIHKPLTTEFVTRSGRISKPAARYSEPASNAGPVDPEDLENESASSESGKADEPLPKLIVKLKLSDSSFKKIGQLTKAAKLKLSRTSKPSKMTPKPLRTPAARNSTPRTPAARKPVGAGAGILTPPTEEDEMDIAAFEPEAQIDPEQLRISRKLTTRSPIDSKPAPQESPEVWADSRQALCETLPYFKMPQSGCHQNDGHVYSFLYDGASRCREYMDADVIIGGAGGGMEFDTTTGQLVQRKSHTMEEAQVKAVLNDIEHKNPLVIICGNKCEGALCAMPHRYNVLGWFKPNAVWAEKTMGKKQIFINIKYRFERLDQTKKAWHAPIGDSPLTTEERQSVGSLLKRACQTCGTSYSAIYLIGWMCLTPDCDQFWKLPNGKDAPYGKLDYNPAFLLERTEWANEMEPFSIKPPVLDVGHAIGDNLTQINTRGMCCPACGRCNSRRLFKGWSCENPTCTYTNFPKHLPVEIPLLHQPWESVGNGPSLARNKHDKSQGVRLAVDFKHGYKVHRYTPEGIDGSLLHMVSNRTINKLPGGADDMFKAMQHHELHLERRRFGVEKKSGGKAEDTSQVAADAASVAGPSKVSSAPSLASNKKPNPGNEKKKQELEDGDFMTAFSMNYGMPYKFVANGASLPFKDSPWPVRAARADLNWAAQNFLDPKDFQDLNEELIFAYMEGQKLEYHDDGEEGLGPQIATLSLGGKAKMHLRIKTKHYVGCSKTGVLVKERPIPGSIGGIVDGMELTSQEMYERRLAAWEELRQLTDTKAYNKRAKEIPLELGLYEKRMKKADDLVTITLNHGDIVLMEGYDVQKYCEHKVVPEQCLRFALTCRTILPDHLKPEERSSYGPEPDEEGMSALRRMANHADGATHSQSSPEVVGEESIARMANTGTELKEN